jgi:hypothetical protein
MIRVIVISMKFGTISENVWKRMRKNPLKLKDIASGLTQFGWVKTPPDDVLNEIAETLVR